MPVEVMRGPRTRPAFTSSDEARIIFVLLDGSCVVVTPKARLARYFQFTCACVPMLLLPVWAWTSTKPGSSTRPPASITSASP